MNEPDTTSLPQRSLPTTVIAAVIVTVLFVLTGLVLAALDIIHTAGTRPIESAATPQLTLPLIAAAYLLIAAGWTFWFARGHGLRALGTMIGTVLSVVLLVVTGTLAWQSLTASRALTVTTMTCEASALKVSGGNPLETCTDTAADSSTTLSGMNSNDKWETSTSADSTAQVFDELPAGSWTARIAVDGQDDTVAVYVVAERDGRWTRIAQLRPAPDETSGRLRWSGTVATSASDTDLRVQYFASENPAVESASIRFTVMGCEGQSIRTFDASVCEPLAIDAAFVQEQSPQGARTWRQPYVFTEGSTLVVTNLEARTYDLAPNYATIQTVTNSTDILVIPSAMAQTESNSVVIPGDSSFPVEITTSTSAIEYTIYVFPAGATFAVAPR